MANSVVIELDGDPVPKGRPRFVSRGGKAEAYTPNKTRSYERTLGWAARAVMGARPLLTGPLSMSVVVYLSTPASWSRARRRRAIAGEIAPYRKPDLDNFVKCVIDSLNCVVYCDDAQIVFLTASKRYSDRPRVWVEVSTIANKENNYEHTSNDVGV